MTHEERIEKRIDKLADVICGIKYGNPTFTPLVNRDECHRLAERIYPKLSTLGCVWLAEDQKWPTTEPDMSQEWNRGFTTAMMCCEKAGFRRIEEEK